MAKDVSVELYDLLVKKGTYEKVSDINSDIYEKFISRYGFPTLDLFCPNCKDNKTFVQTNWNYVDGLGSYQKGSQRFQNIRSLYYHCPTCGQSVFYLFYYNGNEIIKLAQYPSLYDVSRDELKNIKRTS